MKTVLVLAAIAFGVALFTPSFYGETYARGRCYDNPNCGYGPQGQRGRRWGQKGKHLGDPVFHRWQIQ